MSANIPTRRRRRTPLVIVTGAVVAAAMLSGCTPEPREFTVDEVTDGTTAFIVVSNPGDAPRLSYSPDSGVELLDVRAESDTLAFKDLNRNGDLDMWEDWRETPAARAAALAKELTIDQIAGLMLFSPAERTPADGFTDAQQTYLSDNYLRNVLNNGPSEVEPVVTWANQMQAFAEVESSGELPYVPVNFSSDPKFIAYGSVAGSSNAAAAGPMSRWPSSPGLAALFDPERVQEFGDLTSDEYRALGITTALSPQIDVSTDPRWIRFSGTFGEDVELGTELATATVDGFQNNFEGDEPVRWGKGTVNTMIKHFPGDGMSEGGRESHNTSGQYAVFPGDGFEDSLKPFLGALDAAAVMTSYSIAVDGDGEPLFSERVGTAYDKDRIDILREDNDYDGVIVTDWGVTERTAWGAGDLTVDERHYAILRAGADMFGGNTEAAPVLAAYDLWEADFEAGRNDVDADTRFRESAARILGMLFQVGLYEDPYLQLDESLAIVGSDSRTEAGLEAQRDSVVVVKNSDNTITEGTADDWSDKTVYIPRSYDIGYSNSGNEPQYSEAPTVSLEVAGEYFGTVVTDEAVLDDAGKVVSYTAPDLTDVDLVLVGMRSPGNGTNQSQAGRDAATGTFYPLSLQYRPYTADGDNVRRTSLAGDTLPDGSQENRSYFGATSRISNEADLDAFERARTEIEATGRDIPLVAAVRANNPVIPTEFEADSDAILIGFGVTDNAILDVALGLHEPQGRLPLAFPASMDAVEAQLEDVPGDTEAYVDSVGNVYEFGFGLNWSGKIDK